MSNIAMAGGATGSGTVTLLAPSTSTNRTINLPDSNGTILTTATAGVPVNGPAFSAYQSSAQTLSSATFTKLLFQTEEWDTNSNFASSTFTPTVAGYYQVSGGLAIAAANTGIRVAIYKNGTVFKYLSYDYSAAAGAAYGSALVYLNGSSDYIELYCRIAVGQALDALLYATYFQAAMARSAT